MAEEEVEYDEEYDEQNEEEYEDEKEESILPINEGWIPSPELDFIRKRDCTGYMCIHRSKE